MYESAISITVSHNIVTNLLILKKFPEPNVVKSGHPFRKDLGCVTYKGWITNNKQVILSLGRCRYKLKSLS